MTAATHAKPRTSLLDRLRRRKSAAEDIPRGEHPYPAIASVAAANEALRTAPFKREFAGASGTGQLEPRLPDSTDMLAKILDDAKPEQVKVLERTRDALRNLDEPEPLAWLRQAITGGMGWQLTGNPEYLGLEPAGDDGGQVAEVGLGIGPGFPAALRGNREYLDTLLMVIAQARDALVDSERVTPSRDTAPSIAPAPAEDTEAVTAEAAEPAPAPDVIGHARTVLARAEAFPLPGDEHAVYQSGQPVAPVRDDGGDTADEAPEGSAA